MALLLTHVLCLRISEALNLRAEDFSLQAKSVYIGPLKGQAGFRKPMIPEIRKAFMHLQKNAVKAARSSWVCAIHRSMAVAHYGFPAFI